MKKLIFCLSLLISICSISQKMYKPNPAYSYSIVKAAYLSKQPVFSLGVDSCKHFYFTHFNGFDSLLSKVVAYGDTAKYIRIYFSFIVDKVGIPYDAKFEKIAATSFPNSLHARTLSYFNNDQKYYEHLLQLMILKMSWWKPGLLNGLPVDSRVDDYIQFWVGLSLPR